MERKWCLLCRDWVDPVIRGFGLGREGGSGREQVPGVAMETCPNDDGTASGHVLVPEPPADALSRFRVRVVASYAATEPSPMAHLSTEHSDDVRKRVLDLAMNHPDQPDLADLSIHEGAVDAATFADPPLLVLTIVYDVDAPSEQDARSDALGLFKQLEVDRELPEAETVLAHIDDDE